MDAPKFLRLPAVSTVCSSNLKRWISRQRVMRAMRPQEREHVNSPECHIECRLNSKRLMSVYVQTISRAMELPTKGSAAETILRASSVMLAESRQMCKLISVMSTTAQSLFPWNFPGSGTMCDEVSGGGGVETHAEESVHEGSVSDLEEELANCRKSKRC